MSSILLFVGGEATLDKDLPTLIKAASPHKTFINIATNAYRLDEDKIRHFKKLGVDKFIASIDSWSKEEHDEQRGVKGAYESVFNALRLCKKNRY